MREIKFRVWSNKGWIKDCIESSISLSPDGDITVYDDQCHVDYSYENKEVSFYTGLKDKNGKEIYEGDIVSVDWYQNFYSDKSKPERQIIVIEIDPGHTLRKESCGGPDGMIWPENIEVIGNIYENPELLEQ